MSGSLLLICLSLLVFTSFFRILRKYCFDLWLISHIVLAVSVIVTAVIHKVNSILYVAAWWILDLIMRYLIMAGCRYPTKAMVRKIEPDICEVRFPKPPGFSFNPGQFVQIAVRKINPFAFHPISISSAPHEPEVTLHIRGLGGWTERLVELSEKEQEVPIFLEGPYGSLGVDIDDPEKYKYILLVCGGIGVTHCQSVGKALQYQLREERRPLKKMRLIWVARSLEMVRGMPPLEDQFSRTAADKIISKEIYYTGRADHEEDPLPLDTRLFNHRPDLDEIFQEMKEETIKAGEVNIAVFGCGPDKLMTALRECCRRHSQSTVACGRSGVQFDLHTETFDF
jgi:predicted ferric reductase